MPLFIKCRRCRFSVDQPLGLAGAILSASIALVSCGPEAGGEAAGDRRIGAGGPDESEGPSLGTTFAELREVPPPTGRGSMTPYLSAGREGTVYLSWQEPDERGHAVRMAELSASGWSEPHTIARGEDFFVNWADFPSIVELPDGSLAAHWLQREGPGTYAYGVRIARSGDGGESWSAPVTPHLDGTLTEHGFVSLFPAAEGALAAVWLDGRDFAQAATGGPLEGDMSLRYAEIGDDGAPRNQTLLDARACDCCQTSAGLTSEGPVLVYRDRSESEIRDISVVRRVGSEWTAPATLHADGWYMPACPVNGPAVAAKEERVAVAWYTGAADEPKVQVAFSGDAGASFGPPLRIDQGKPLGRVDVVLLPDGSALVLWLETGEEGARVTARRVRADGATSTAATVALTDVSRSSGFPRMMVLGNDVILAWTDTGPDGSVHAAVASLPLRSEVDRPRRR